MGMNKIEQYGKPLTKKQIKEYRKQLFYPKIPKPFTIITKRGRKIRSKNYGNYINVNWEVSGMNVNKFKDIIKELINK